MDILLGIADDILFDRLWAKLVPLSAFTSSPEFLSTANATSKYLPLGSPSKWTEFIAGLPHPPISSTTISSYTSSGIVPNVSAWPRDYIPRQLLSLTLLTMVGVHIMYFLFAGLSYYFVFNHEMKKHPKYLKNQIKLEIIASLKAFPPLMMMHLPIFQAEVMGYSKLYEGVDTYGYFWFFASVPIFLFFTDYCIYWIHRWLHIPAIYKRLHKPHHKWLVPTPFAAYAFHPLDGMAQAIPYHLFPFIFPLHKMVYLVLFVFVNVWTILIHDSDMLTGHPLEKVINGPAHHTLHHLYFTVNYGQYFTWADRVGGSYRQPDSSLDPLLEIKKESTKKEQ